MKYKLPILCSLLLLSCNPKRDNPYDPQSSQYKGDGTIRGRVTTGTGAPIYKALVSTVPPKFATLTDSSGNFILYPDTGEWKIMSSYAGYVPETLQIYIALDTIKEISFYLDGLPVIQSPYTISCHEDKGFPIGDIYWVEVGSKISDPDGIQDIDSVRLSVNLGSKEINMYLFPKGSSYFVSIPQDSCPGRNMENIVGKPFVLYAIDKKKAVSSSPNFYVPRLIYSLPYLLSPGYGDSVFIADTIKFVWQRIKADFPITYKLTIQDYNSLDTALVKDNVMDTTAIVTSPPDNLPPARYIWTVEGKDEFGDISRSDNASFLVK